MGEEGGEERAMPMRRPPRGTTSGSGFVAVAVLVVADRRRTEKEEKLRERPEKEPVGAGGTRVGRMGAARMIEGW